MVFAKKGEPTPCSGCENEPPLAGPGNELVEVLFAPLFGCRDGWGGFVWQTLLQVMHAEGIGPEEQLEILHKVSAIETVVARVRAEESEERVKNQQGKAQANAAPHPPVRR